jgi:hypothetical protein
MLREHIIVIKQEDLKLWYHVGNHDLEDSFETSERKILHTCFKVGFNNT